MRKQSVVALTAVALSACALKGDVRRVEEQLAEMRAETARADSLQSARADDVTARLDALIRLQRAVLDSIADVEGRLVQLRAESRSDHTAIDRQLVQIQELTGQSQQRLSELGTRLRQREAQQGDVATGVPGDSGAVAGNVDARELYDASLQQLRRSSAATARDGFRYLLENFPADPVAPDAQYMLGEAWEQSNPDSAAVAFEAVARDYPDSPRAPSALYKLGSISLRAGRTEEARRYFQRVVAGYPASDEAALAQSRLGSLNR